MIKSSIPDIIIIEGLRVICRRGRRRSAGSLRRTTGSQMIVTSQSIKRSDRLLISLLFLLILIQGTPSKGTSGATSSGRVLRPRSGKEASSSGGPSQSRSIAIGSSPNRSNSSNIATSSAILNVNSLERETETQSSFTGPGQITGDSALTNSSLNTDTDMLSSDTYALNQRHSFHDNTREFSTYLQ